MLRNGTPSTSSSEMSLITHRGPWDAHSRQYKTLRFLESYLNTLDESKLKSTPCTTFFSPNAVFHDTKGDVYLSGSHIWAWMKRLFAPFELVTHEIVEVRVIPETEERFVVYGEFVRHFKLRDGRANIVSPMFSIVTIGPAEVRTSLLSHLQKTRRPWYFKLRWSFCVWISADVPHSARGEPKDCKYMKRVFSGTQESFPSILRAKRRNRSDDLEEMVIEAEEH
ncbi:hypothetical protein BKA65DRAFT_499498 [Rhexocercosporidium sp. MPI-PUGE-AT-0058]|nr:hypothetical protein BKA65DRAFT_499498 [Rhexocercosporidium sp. MPI-PUGE-AT-0058]